MLISLLYQVLVFSFLFFPERLLYIQYNSITCFKPCFIMVPVLLVYVETSIQTFLLLEVTHELQFLQGLLDQQWLKVAHGLKALVLLIKHIKTHPMLKSLAARMSRKATHTHFLNK